MKLFERRKQPPPPDCCRAGDGPNRSTWEADPGGLHVCMRLVEISEPFNAGQDVELKFEASGCHRVHAGELRLRFAPEDAGEFYLGDELSMRLRLI